MKSVDVCVSPDLMHLYTVEGKSVVVVDILRATSSMVTGFAHGVSGIFPVARLEDCRAMKSKGYLIAGEREGEKVPDFDLGNSPFEYMAAELNGKLIALTTTNGTQAIAKSIGAAEIIIGAFLNLSAVANHLIKSNNDILIVCAGWKGKVNLEDTVFAGALVEKLSDKFSLACDAPLAAKHLYNCAKGDLIGFLNESSHVKRLNKLNIHDDMKFCCTIDEYKVVPVLKNGVLVV
ncbi:MAG TPA: 2-phosphosulfolactate phosphatase [Cyclobacteriaceae bacterium]|nr:2-phosphosulfolactate phosphatase [Cyclobacteriaceae bacterium]HMV09093.1 2-phosphosulfolactate phosphatase [Cyclobacteriaceae bacterium]HMV90666.1 2-phosphosulfolactate phosphatase [Cyclobacteriaceae bacterium]HMW99502.1 2-phosphosulfolactate phosphatase [Cyclobacteriaceae bacterium]HMX48709.1 2-phosphosulfolactate phosphatase [Cyclobacteriaceae bacterium]